MQLKTFFLNREDKIFIQNNISSGKEEKKNKILIQVSIDYFFLLLLKILKLSKYKNYEIHGIWTTTILTCRKKLIFENFQNNIKNKIYNFFLKKKFYKLFSSIGVKIIFDINNEKKINVNRLKNISKNIFNNLQNKKDVLKIRYNKILIGDLIYDSYIRYRVVPTVNINDRFLYDIILKSLKAIEFCEINLNSKGYKLYHTAYTSYINNGLVPRYFLYKRKKVYSSGDGFSVIKKLSINNFSHMKNFSQFKKKFSKLNNKNKKLLQAKKEFKKKISGKIDISSAYMNNKSYKDNTPHVPKKLNNIDGVLFLHDIYDAVHDHSGLIFNDFYDWTVFSLDAIRDFNLNIAIKPHPNSVHEGNETYLKLKKKYSNLFWLSPEISNRQILSKKNVLFAISMVGSVIYEIIYFNKLGICAGNSPSSSFKSTLTAKNLDEYKKYLINSKYLSNKIKVNKLDLYKTYYVNFLYDLFEKEKKFLDIGLYKLLDRGNNSKLNYFDKKINEKYLQKN